MSSGPIATATVRVIPDTTGFRAALQAQLKAATAGLTVPIGATAGGVTGVGGGGGGKARGAAGGVNALTKESQALRGSLIGLSRVTPVTVFGLGVYGTAAIAAGYAIKGAIRATADFEHQLYVFQATTNATADEMEAISEKAKELGRDLSLPSTSAGDAALAMTELAKAGLTVEDTLAGSTGVLQLAAAAQLDVGTAAQFVATQLNAFGLAGTEATHVADLLAGASIAAQGDIRDFGTSFQQVSAVAKQADVSIETTTGALTELAKAGLRGADGGTSLRTTLLRLTPTTKQAADYQKILGIELDQTRTLGEQLPELLDKYKAALSALTPIQQQQVKTQIVGQDAIRAFSILVEGGSRALEENTRAADQNGAANRLAQANAKGLSGAFNGLKSNLETLGITLGEVASGPLEEFVRGLSDVVTFSSDAVIALGDFASAAKGVSDQINDFLFLGVPEDKKNGIASFFSNIATAVAIGPLTAGLISLGSDDPSALLPGQTGGGGRTDPRFANQRGGNLGVDPSVTTAQAKAIRARFIAEQEKARKSTPIPADTIAPNKLAIAQLNAQLKGDLQAELDADKAIEAYFRERLKLAKKGSDRYREILGAQQNANAAVRSIQDQINSEAEAAAAERKRASDEAKRIAEKNAADAAQAAKDLFNLQKSRLDLNIAAAGLTKPIQDDIRANRAEIRFFNAQIKRIEAIKKRRKLTIEEEQAVVDYRTAIVGLRSTIQGLKDDAKKASGDSASPEDFFRAAVENFRAFGGGTSGIISAQGARGSLAGRVLGAGRPGGAGGGTADRVANAVEDARQAQARRDAAALAESRRQTALLRKIVVHNRGGKGAPLGRAVRLAEGANQTRTSVAGGKDF